VSSWYCGPDRTYDDETILIQHQRTKHFQCPTCHKKLTTATALKSHCLYVHKEEITRVPNARDGKDSFDFDIVGMDGVAEAEEAALVAADPSKKQKTGPTTAAPAAPSNPYGGVLPPGQLASNPYAQMAQQMAAQMGIPQPGMPYGGVPGLPGVPMPYPGMMTGTPGMMPGMMPGMQPGMPPGMQQPGMPPGMPQQPGMPSGMAQQPSNPYAQQQPNPYAPQLRPNPYPQQQLLPQQYGAQPPPQQYGAQPPPQNPYGQQQPPPQNTYGQTVIYIYISCIYMHIYTYIHIFTTYVHIFIYFYTCTW